MSFQNNHEILSIVILVILIFCHLSLASFDCEVDIADKWEEKTYLPHNSSLLINCTSNSTTQDAVWAIRLPETGNFIRFDRGSQLLNNRGLYRLSVVLMGNKKIIRLVLNTTEGNNGTVIQCFDRGTASIINVTTIMVYDPIPVEIDEMHYVDLHKVNISWSPIRHFSESNSALIVYTMTVKSPYTSPQVFTGNRPYEIYTAPEDASPCEVYNFSVTATYVGVTYTGAGCSVPSNVISEMLPSLPDVRDLQSSLNSSLEKTSNHVKLSITFKPARSCSGYPVLNYTLEVEGQPNDMMSFTSLSNKLTINNLQQDSEYTFKIVARNAFSFASSNETRIYTTDVQTANILLLNGAKTITVQCTLISKSDARGCLVVMVDHSGTAIQTMNVTKTNTSNQNSVLESSFSLLNYRPFCDNHNLKVYVVAYDIEADSTNGSLAVPGNFEKSSGTDADLQELCNQISGTTLLLPQFVYALLLVLFTTVTVIMLSSFV